MFRYITGIVSTLLWFSAWTLNCMEEITHLQAFMLLAISHLLAFETLKTNNLKEMLKDVTTSYKIQVVLLTILDLVFISVFSSVLAPVTIAVLTMITIFIESRKTVI